MLRQDVVEACAASRFAVWAVRTVDEAMEVLTGLPAGEADAEGVWPEDSVNGIVAAGLDNLAAQALAYMAVASGRLGGADAGDGPGGAGRAAGAKRRARRRRKGSTTT
jgi:hypothetical protein